MKDCKEFKSSFVSNLRATLSDNQKKLVMRCYDVLRSDYRSCILAENCGGGKTLISLVILQMLKSNKKPFLVVAPISAISSWEDDMKRHFSPNLRNVVVQASKYTFSEIDLRDPPIVIISYHMLSTAYKYAKKRREMAIQDEMNRINQRYPKMIDMDKIPISEHQTYTTMRKYYSRLEEVLECMRNKKKKFSFNDISKILPERITKLEQPSHTTLLKHCIYSICWRTLVLDEAHVVRNSCNDRFIAVSNINSDMKHLISATPCNNNMNDLLSLFSIMNVTVCDRDTNTVNASALNAVCRDVFVASSKKDQQQTEQSYGIVRTMFYVPFKTLQEREDYDRVHQSWLNRFDSDDIDKKWKNAMQKKNIDCGLDTTCKNSDNIFAVITNLRQKCDTYTKIHIVCEYLRKKVIPTEEKAVVFTSFLSTLANLIENISATFKHSIKIFKITGAVSRTSRVAIINNFSKWRGPAVIVATTTSINLGMDLDAANHAILMNIWWNYSVQAQALRRLSRPQQKNSLFWNYIIIKHTIEESIWLVSEIKSKLNQKVVYADINNEILTTVTSKYALSTTSSNNTEILNDDNLSKSISPSMKLDNVKFLETLHRLAPNAIETRCASTSTTVTCSDSDNNNDILKPDSIVGIRNIMSKSHDYVFENGNDIDELPNSYQLTTRSIPKQRNQQLLLVDCPVSVPRRIDYNKIEHLQSRANVSPRFLTLRTRSDSFINFDQSKRRSIKRPRYGIPRRIQSSENETKREVKSFGSTRLTSSLSTERTSSSPLIFEECKGNDKHPIHKTTTNTGTINNNKKQKIVVQEKTCKPLKDLRDALDVLSNI